MSRKITTYNKPLVQALAALIAVLGVGLIGATPARADHGPDVGFSFSFGFPAPFFPVPVPMYAPPVVYREAPVYYAPPRVIYYERPVRYYGHGDNHWRKHDRHDRWDGDRRHGRNRSGYRDARW